MRGVPLTLFGILVFSLALAKGMALFDTTTVTSYAPRTAAEHATSSFASVATATAVAVLRRAMY